ncbi:hypothetical protein AYI70_g875 [Smittium culicis]|uniref:Uncharacterized protein n=1 Tax=Smittium culicis TaxID=133412 RepID=A0A1R1YF96_9FUNG|nr:hypothetical protein AYI70_g875 [Smittium culicis]
MSFDKNGNKGGGTDNDFNISPISVMGNSYIAQSAPMNIPHPIARRASNSMNAGFNQFSPPNSYSRASSFSFPRSFFNSSIPNSTILNTNPDINQNVAFNHPLQHSKTMPSGSSRISHSHGHRESINTGSVIDSANSVGSSASGSSFLHSIFGQGHRFSPASSINDNLPIVNSKMSSKPLYSSELAPPSDNNDINSVLNRPKTPMEKMISEGMFLD